MNLIDSHAHVDVSDFDADRDAMLDRARAAGVGTLLAIGNGPEIEKLGAAVPYAETHDWIYAAAGIHPHEARHATDAHYAELDRLARNPRLIAWGEIGLDYHYDHSPRDVQAQRVSPSAGAGARRAAARDHPLPRSVAGLPEDSGGRLAQFRPGRNLSLLYGNAGGGAAAAWRWVS